jgi:hypothetical protein
VGTVLMSRKLDTFECRCAVLFLVVCHLILVRPNLSCSQCLCVYSVPLWLKWFGKIHHRGTESSLRHRENKIR